MSGLPNLSVWIDGAPMPEGMRELLAHLVPYGSEPIGCVPWTGGLNVAFRTENGQRGQRFFVLQSTEVDHSEPDKVK